MTDDIETAYDQFAYPSGAITDTHPRRLATIAMLHGMTPAPPSGCRVLELGCGEGENLIGMAFTAPHSEFVGIDISGRSIEDGRRLVSELALTNVDLRHCDIMQVGGEFGAFDYVIAHGVYSWVPPAVREALLAIFKSHLRPQGVGYVSYNAYPGSHLRNVARDILRFHSRDKAPGDAVQDGLAMMKAIAAANADETSPYAAVLREQSKELEQRAEQVIHHDDLSSAFTPFLLQEVAAAAGRHRLQYLSDAVFSSTQTARLSEAGRNIVQHIPKERQVEREQYIDFIVGRSFRRSLLCHDDIVLRREISPDKIRDHFIAGKFALTGGGSGDPFPPGTVEIQGPAGSLQTDNAAVKIALLHLGALWPAAISFGALAEHTVGTMQRAGLIREGDGARLAQALLSVIFLTYEGGHVDLYCEPLPLTRAISAHPEVSRLARKQAETRSSVSNLRHGGVDLTNAVTRRFLTMVDGTRSIDDLIEDLTTALDQSRQQGEPRVEATRDQVTAMLAEMGKLALLAR